MERTVYIGFRVSVEEAAKVAGLAAASMRSRSDLLRLLVHQARLTDGSGVVLDGCGHGAGSDLGSDRAVRPEEPGHG